MFHAFSHVKLYYRFGRLLTVIVPLSCQLMKCLATVFIESYQYNLKGI